MYFPVILLLISKVLVCRTQFLHTLGDATVAKYDIEARRQILIEIVKMINDTVNQQSGVIKGCEANINATIDQCIACRQDLCQSSVPIDQAILQTVGAALNVPIAFAGKSIEDLVSFFNKQGDFFDDRAAEFANGLGSTANSIGNAFENQFALSNLAKDFEKLGSELGKLGVEINNRLLNPLEGFLNLGAGITDLDKYIGDALRGVESSLQSSLNFFSNLGNDIGNFFSGLFKRKLMLRLQQRCVQSCPVCDKVDSKKYTTMEIMEKVCGKSVVDGQSAAVNDLEWLRNHVNYTVNGVNVTKVEYEWNPADPTHMTITDQGVVINNAWFTANDGVRRQLNGGLYFTPKISGPVIGEQYFGVRWNSRNT